MLVFEKQTRWSQMAFVNFHIIYPSLQMIRILYVYMCDCKGANYKYLRRHKDAAPESISPLCQDSDYVKKIVDKDLFCQQIRYSYNLYDYTKK